ncbi:MAG: hypothetical protein R3338_06285, partial [Thermoanaerobaculia bacterium]|nr:hypothetical protein [Thermoanaerobaculia bacterium]
GRYFTARKAMGELERSVELDPDNGDAAIDLILIHIRVPILGDGLEAAERLTRRLDGRGSPLLPLARGILAFEREKWNQAEEELIGAAGTLEDPRRALFWLGFLYQRLGRWDDAWETHERLYRLSPRDPRVLYEFARTAEFSGERVALGKKMIHRYLVSDLPSGAASKEEARALLERLEDRN